jgi:hypothetical protein
VSALGCAQLPGSCTQQLPPVTIVFAEVAEGKALVRQKPELALMVHTTLLGLLQVGTRLLLAVSCRVGAFRAARVLSHTQPLWRPRKLLVQRCANVCWAAGNQSLHDVLVLSVCVHVCCWQVLLAALPEQDGQPPGYLCRQQEQCMRFMLAFNQPNRALEWCLMMQVRRAAG